MADHQGAILASSMGALSGLRGQHHCTGPGRPYLGAALGSEEFADEFVKK